MTDLDRGSLLTRLARAVAEADGGRPLEARLCSAYLSIVGGEGAAITLSYTRPERVTVCFTDDVAARLEDLQDVLGEGPGSAAYESRGIMIADLRYPGRWPLFVDAARKIAGTQVVYAVPMQPAAEVIGVLTVHQSTPELPDREQAQFLADAIGAALVKDPPSQDSDLTSGPWSARSAIHQATGMVLAQLKIGPEDAMALLRAHAFSHDTTLANVAEQIISRRLRFSDEAESEDS